MVGKKPRWTHRGFLFYHQIDCVTVIFSCSIPAKRSRYLASLLSQKLTVEPKTGSNLNAIFSVNETLPLISKLIVALLDQAVT